MTSSSDGQLFPYPFGCGALYPSPLRPGEVHGEVAVPSISSAPGKQRESRRDESTEEQKAEVSSR